MYSDSVRGRGFSSGVAVACTCPHRPECFDAAGVRRRILASSCYPAFYRGHQRIGTSEYLHMMRRRKIWAEGSFAEGSFAAMKREHKLSKIRKRGIQAATEECLMAALALNLKRMVGVAQYYVIFFAWGRKQPVFCPIVCFVNRFNS